MLDTSRIKSEFDAELQLGGQWFLTAIQALDDNGALNLPNGITITDVVIIDDPDWDFNLTTSLGITVRAAIEIVNNQFAFSTDFNNDTFEIDMPIFGELAGPPELQKVIGDSNFENAMVLLINLDLLSMPQNEDPTASQDHLDRGDPSLAISFLPNGQHLALGFTKETFKRIANNFWHTELRDTDGSHPLPAPEEEKIGDWKKIKVSVTKQRIKLTLEGEVPIDIWPDANVTVEITLKPKLKDGRLNFEIDTDLDVDTGFWGDVLAFTVGALAGLLIGLITGGFALMPALAIGMVIVLEVGEYVVGEVLERRYLAIDKNGNRLSELSCNDEIIQYASPSPPEDGISLNGALDAVPSSIPVLLDNDDPLFTRMVTVTSIFDEITLNGKGLAVAGKTGTVDLFEPRVARLVESIYDQAGLQQLRYQVPATGEESTLDLNEVLNRLSTNELGPPVKVEGEFDDPLLDIPSGRLCCPCLTPTQIRREDTVITRIKFDTGLELDTQDAVMLQDNAGIYLNGLQLIHPSNANPYFRAPANQTETDNFEGLPGF